MKTKTRKIRKAVLLTAVALLSISFVQAASGNQDTQRRNSTTITCVNDLPGLNDSQISSIVKMEADHQKVMDELRTQRRATTDEKTKTEIRLKMIEKRDAHRAAVSKLLTPEQQVAYNNLHNYDRHLHQQGNNSRESGNHTRRNGTGNGSCRR